MPVWKIIIPLVTQSLALANPSSIYIKHGLMATLGRFLFTSCIFPFVLGVLTTTSDKSQASHSRNLGNLFTHNTTLEGVNTSHV